MSDELLLRFEGRPAAAGEARAAVASFAERHLGPTRVSDFAVAVSEVITNAILHGDPGGPIEVRASRSEDSLRVEVTDNGSGLASSPRSRTSRPEGGFGLFLVEQMSRRWGLVRNDATTRVWFEFEAA